MMWADPLLLQSVWNLVCLNYFGCVFCVASFFAVVALLSVGWTFFCYMATSTVSTVFEEEDFRDLTLIFCLRLPLLHLCWLLVCSTSCYFPVWFHGCSRFKWLCWVLVHYLSAEIYSKSLLESYTLSSHWSNTYVTNEWLNAHTLFLIPWMNWFIRHFHLTFFLLWDPNGQCVLATGYIYSLNVANKILMSQSSSINNLNYFLFSLKQPWS